MQTLRAGGVRAVRAWLTPWSVLDAAGRLTPACPRQSICKCCLTVLPAGQPLYLYIHREQELP
jgi:hypothetical protein